MPASLRVVLLLVAAAVAFPDGVTFAASACGVGCASTEAEAARPARGLASTKAKVDPDGHPAAIQADPLDDPDDPDGEGHRFLTAVPGSPAPSVVDFDVPRDLPCPEVRPDDAVGIARLCRFRC
jgi:hypothetical protein